MTREERDKIVANMTGEKYLSFYASAVNQTPLESTPQRFENEGEKELYSCMLREIREETEQLINQGINPIWEIPLA